MAESRFVYVTYIRTTPEKLWQALIDPEFTRQYWCGTTAGMRLEAGLVVEDDDARRTRGRQRRGARIDPREAARPQVAERIRARAEGGGLLADDVRARDGRAIR